MPLYSGAFVTLGYMGGAMKNRLAICTAWTLACLPITACSKPETTQLPVAVEATGIEHVDDRWLLDMRVWNCSDKPLTVDITNLPWGGMLANRLLLYHTPSSRTVQPSYPIEDFPETPYTIPAGRYVLGKTELSHYFHSDLSKVKHPENWVVFWMYEPFGLHGEPIGKKFGGMMPLDQKPSTPPVSNACAGRAPSQRTSPAESSTQSE